MHDAASAEITPDSPQPGRWFTVGIALLSALFWFSLLAKLHDIRGFELILRQQHIVETRDAAQYLARFVVFWELIIAVGLWIPWRRVRVALPITLGTLLFFTGYMLYLASRGADGNCGCFGTAVEMSPFAAAMKNLPFIVIAGLLMRVGPAERQGSPLALGLACAGILVGCVLGLPIRPAIPVVADRAGEGAIIPAEENAVDTITDTPSPFTPFTPFQPTPVDLTEGLHFVAFLSLDCEHCQQLTRDLVASEAMLPAPIALVCLGDAAELPGFRTETGGQFPAHMADPLAFFDMIGDAPPRLYLVRDGQPIAYWEGESIDLDMVLVEAAGKL